MPLSDAIQQFSMAELVKLFSNTSPAFLAYVVRAKSLKNTGEQS